MPALSEYANVFDTAVAVLERKGYQVWVSPRTDLVWAQRDGWDFAAETPIALLGLVAIYEHTRPAGYTEYWWRTEPERRYADLPTTPPDYHPVTDRRGEL